MEMSLSSAIKSGLCALVVASALIAWWFWPTETRRVARVIKRLETAVEAADPQELMKTVSPRYNHDGITYAELASCAHTFTSLVGPCRVLVLRQRINVQGGLASAVLDVLATASSKDPRFRGTDRSSWRVSFRKENGEWLVHKVDPVSVHYGRMSMFSVDDFRRWFKQ